MPDANVPRALGASSPERLTNVLLKMVLLETHFPGVMHFGHLGMSRCT